MLLITCEVNLILTWSGDFVISSATGAKNIWNSNFSSNFTNSKNVITKTGIRF